MKKEQGITLISLIVYVILLTFIVAAISSITSSFYANINNFDNESESAVAYSKFNMYFLNDIKRKDAKIEEAHNDYIILSYIKSDENSEPDEGISVSGDETINVEYLVQNNILYRNKVKICEDVESILIEADEQNNTVKIKMKIGDYEKTTTYVLEHIDIEDTESGDII